MINRSEYFVHATKDGVTQSFGPGEDIPDWVKVDNPFVTGKATDASSEGDDTNDEVEDEVEDKKPRRRPRKAASGS